MGVWGGVIALHCIVLHVLHVAGPVDHGDKFFRFFIVDFTMEVEWLH